MIHQELAIDRACEEYLEKSLLMFDQMTRSDVLKNVERMSEPLAPVLIEDYGNLSSGEKSQIFDAYHSYFGCAHIMASESDNERVMHPLLTIAEQLSDILPLKFPINHPMEGNAGATRDVGPGDGTLKIYNIQRNYLPSDYKEQVETDQAFLAHNDGLGYAGKVEALFMYLDSAPYWGGTTFFQNLLAVSIKLAHENYKAFRSLFYPDAINVIRPRGKGALSVNSPVLYIDDKGSPKVFFRVSSGEYIVTPNAKYQFVEDAFSFLQYYSQPFAPGSSFVTFSRRGQGCIVRNSHIVHGRTRFIDSSKYRRVLARKWFMAEEKFTTYYHVPGMYLSQELVSAFPQMANNSQLEGEWNLDPRTGANVRIG